MGWEFKSGPLVFSRGSKGFDRFALYEAQLGGKHYSAKPLRGFGGSGILEVVDDYDGSTYRAVYTVRLHGRIYVLHAFQKKSKTGIKTPQSEINLIRSRLRRAEEEHTSWIQRPKGYSVNG
jgi:phage-related protein